MYVREGVPPTDLDYSAMAARGSPASAPQKVVASPCDLHAVVLWQIGLYLEDEATATSRRSRSGEGSQQRAQSCFP